MSGLLLILWLGLVWSSGWAAYPLARRVFGDTLPDGGLAAGRVLFLVCWTLAAFWLGQAGVPVGISAWLGPVAAGCGLIGLGLRSGSLFDVPEARQRAWFFSEVAFLSAFLLFFFLRGYWSDTNGNNGEKAMDSALIGSLTRARKLPPENPYSAGAALQSYYYGGHLEAALLTKATGTTVRWSYNLMCATVPALCFSLMFSLAAGMTGTLRRGAAVAILVLGAGTLQPLMQWWSWWFDEKVPENLIPQFLHLDFFATSRVIPFTINEYPWFTMNQADLHAHYFDFPVAILTMTLAWAVSKGRGAALPLAGPVLGAMVITNTWDFPAYVILVGSAAFISKRKRTVSQWVQLGLAVGGVMVLALIVAAPYLLHLKTAANPPRPLQQPASDWRYWLLLWGPVLAGWLMALYFLGLRKSLGAGITLFALALLVPRMMTGGAFPVLTLELSLLALTGWGLYRLRGEPQFLCCLALAGFVALLWSETTWAGFLGDPNHMGFDDYKRQDTVFKFGLQVWMLWGMAAAAGAALTWKRWPWWLKGLWVPVLGVMFASSLAVSLGRAAAFGNPYGWVHGIWPAPFDGQRRIDRWDAWAHLMPAEKDAARWLELNTPPGEHIVEASMKDGGDYTEYTRYAHATGIPTVIGPRAHSFQWGPAHTGKPDDEWTEVFRRTDLTNLAFTATSPAVVRAALKDFRVRYIVCGELERREYGVAAIENLEKWFPVVFRAGDATSEHRVEILDLGGS